MKSILQDWVQELGLRHQGVLLTAVRGCDTVPKEAGSKTLTRYLRSAILNAHCGDATKSRSFIEVPASEEAFKAASDQFFVEFDALPLHYIMHLVHAAEILGYYCPIHIFDTIGDRVAVCGLWSNFYHRACRKFHVNPETREQLDARLSCDEETFGAVQKADGAVAVTSTVSLNAAMSQSTKFVPMILESATGCYRTNALSGRWCAAHDERALDQNGQCEVGRADRLAWRLSQEAQITVPFKVVHQGGSYAEVAHEGQKYELHVALTVTDVVLLEGQADPLDASLPAFAAKTCIVATTRRAP